MDRARVCFWEAVPPASGVVDRSGLVLSPLGIARAVEQLRGGDLVTVDGHLGIVTVSPPEFDVELA